MTAYDVQVINNSESGWKFYVYQSPPKEISNLTLAWFASKFVIGPGDQTSFQWKVNYQLMWSANGVIRPGVTFSAEGRKDCDPRTRNTSKFTFVNDEPELADPFFSGEKGQLYIRDGSNVPSKQFAVGVGMSGNPTFAVDAGPNVSHVFTPTPTYYIAAVEEVREGEVMDIETITQYAPIKFPPNVYTATATLKEDNTWSITF